MTKSGNCIVFETGKKSHYHRKCAPKKMRSKNMRSYCVRTKSVRIKSVRTKFFMHLISAGQQSRDTIKRTLFARFART